RARASAAGDQRRAGGTAQAPVSVPVKAGTPASSMDQQQPAKTAPAAAPTGERRRQPVSDFDRVVFGVMALLVLAIAGTVLLGDRVGVTLVRYGPADTARSTSPI